MCQLKHHSILTWKPHVGTQRLAVKIAQFYCLTAQHVSIEPFSWFVRGFFNQLCQHKIGFWAIRNQTDCVFEYAIGAETSTALTFKAHAGSYQALVFQQVNFGAFSTANIKTYSTGCLSNAVIVQCKTPVVFWFVGFLDVRMQ